MGFSKGQEAKGSWEDSARLERQGRCYEPERTVLGGAGERKGSDCWDLPREVVSPRSKAWLPAAEAYPEVGWCPDGGWQAGL